MPKVRRRGELSEMPGDVLEGMSSAKQRRLVRYLAVFKREILEIAVAATNEEIADKIQRITLAGMAKKGAWLELAGMWCLAGDFGVVIDHDAVARELAEREGSALASEYRRRATDFVLTTGPSKPSPQRGRSSRLRGLRGGKS